MKLEYKGVYVFVEQVDSILSSVTFELLGKAKELAADIGTQTTAILLGYGVGGLTEALAKYGADNIIVVEDEKLKTYQTEPYAHGVHSVIEQYKPEIILFGATAIGRDLAPRVSARVHTGLTADCTKLEIDSENKKLKMTRPAFGGNIMATIVCPEHRPQMATVRPGVMQKIKPIKNPNVAIKKYNLIFEPNNKYVEILEVVKKVSNKQDIQDANIIISGGRGMGQKENFSLLEELAKVIGGEVASSRACVDAGWIDKSVQVGQTGKTVRPNLYIACGISGAIQHLAGMEESDVIIAINKDESALIFDVADYGIVGDVLEILPILTQRLKEEMSASRNEYCKG